ncbi:MAG: ATP-binding cassette domain-containing protein, partial [Deinococcota bacterium]
MTSPALELIILEDVHLSRGGRVVLDSVQLTLRSGERWGLVGANGAGKSTLQMLALGKLDASEGRVWWAPGLSLASLPNLDVNLQRYCKRHQLAGTNVEPHLVTVNDLAQTALAEVDALEARLRDAERHLSELVAGDPHLEQALESYTALRDQFEQAGGYTVGQRLEVHLSKFGLVGHQPVHTLSAGESARLALA